MNIGFIPNQTGTGLELQVIAAAVLGGIHLKGGTGSIFGAALGALFFRNNKQLTRLFKNTSILE